MSDLNQKEFAVLFAVLLFAMCALGECGASCAEGERGRFMRECVAEHAPNVCAEAWQRSEAVTLRLRTK